MIRRICTGLSALLAFAGPPLLAQSIDEAARRASDEYAARLSSAADELTRARERVAAEKTPLLEQIGQAEARILSAEGELTRLETRREESAEERRKLLLELDAVRKTTTYLSTIAHEGFKASADSLAPGEEQVIGEAVQAIRDKLDRANEQTRAAAAADAAEFILARTVGALGGYRAPGRATLSESNEIVQGTLAFVGPEAFFRPDDHGSAGALRNREGAAYPVVHPLPLWKTDEAALFFAGETGMMVADASGGKALRLQEITGSVWDHIRKGGLVAFTILGVGMFASVLIVQKARDLARMGSESTFAVNTFLDQLAGGKVDQARDSMRGLKLTTRELFTEGLAHRDKPKPILEEKLAAVLLAQRLRYERRLPLLAVIATAAPLMGLLGTVVGMVKTFALITVFGTGNAAKLSTGISEVLVATELGLAVAIPTLIAHGVLAHRIHKNLSLLERHALQFVTAVEISRLAPAPKTVPEPALA